MSGKSSVKEGKTLVCLPNKLSIGAVRKCSRINSPFSGADFCLCGGVGQLRASLTSLVVDWLHVTSAVFGLRYLIRETIRTLKRCFKQNWPSVVGAAWLSGPCQSSPPAATSAPDAGQSFPRVVPACFLDQRQMTRCSWSTFARGSAANQDWSD